MSFSFLLESVESTSLAEWPTERINRPLFAKVRLVPSSIGMSKSSSHQPGVGQEPTIECLVAVEAIDSRQDSINMTMDTHTEARGNQANDLCHVPQIKKSIHHLDQIREGTSWTNYAWEDNLLTSDKPSESEKQSQVEGCPVVVVFFIIIRALKLSFNPSFCRNN